MQKDHAFRSGSGRNEKREDRQKPAHAALPVCLGGLWCPQVPGDLAGGCGRIGGGVDWASDDNVVRALGNRFRRGHHPFLIPNVRASGAHAGGDDEAVSCFGKATDGAGFQR